MAEAIVSFVVERVGDLLIQESIFLASVQGQVEGMQTELKRMQRFLKEADKRQEFDGNLQGRVSEIRDIAYHVENVIETFALKIASRREKGFRTTCKRHATIFIEGAMLHKLGEDIEAIKTKIADYTASLQRYHLEPKEDEQVSVLKTQQELRRTYSHLVEDNTVGLGEDTKNLVAKLIQEDRSQCQVVTICGMGGMGKTTLANKLYHHGDIRRYFDGFAWAYVSQEFRPRDLWESILTQLISEKKENIINMRDEEIAKKLYQVQLEKKCLVVLDDIWREEAWDALKPAFPIRKASGRIVLTTRNVAVASHVDPTGLLHQPRLLTDEESWELLRKRAFLQENIPDPRIDTNMEKLGREMVGRCGGLPLAIIVLGGLLAKNLNLNEWKKVRKNIDVNIRRGKLQNEQGYLGIEWVLALSYRELPYRIKACFLYLGHFPEDYEIPTTMLFRLWLAEGLVSKTEYEVGGIETTLEDISESYLGELIDRCMVQVGKMGSTSRVKTIRLHDLMRDLCLSKGNHEKFLNIVHCDRNHQVVSHSATSPRLAVYADEIFYETTFDLKNPHLRSLLFFSKTKYYVSPKLIMWTGKNFKFLRVLILERCKIKKRSAEEIGNFVHLRYLCFRECKMKILPESIGNLRYLQTLSVGTRCINPFGTIVSCNVIWKLANLRHLNLGPLGVTTGWLRRVGNLKNLQTLGNIKMRDIDVHELLKLSNLKKLGLLELESLSELEIILQQPGVAFNCLCSLYINSSYTGIYKKTDLKRLFSCCRNLYKLYLSGKIEKLPEYQDFPPNLTKLTLRKSELKEDPMATLNKLPHLSILFLYVNAYIGKKMVCSSGGFPQLKALHLWGIYNLEEWWVDEGAFPSLSLLEIYSCIELKMVPDGLRFITTLREMHILGMPEEFSNRLREGGEDLHKVQHVPSIIIKSKYS